MIFTSDRHLGSLKNGRIGLNRDISVLRDPRNGSPLNHDDSGLVAADGTIFPIVDGIPRFVGSENYAADFG